MGQNILFGALDWKKRAARIGSPDYWNEKTTQDKNANQPIYLDLAEPDLRFKRVAHSGTSVLINGALLEADNSVTDIDQSTVGVDAYTGKAVVLQDKFQIGRASRKLIHWIPRMRLCLPNSLL